MGKPKVYYLIILDFQCDLSKKFWEELICLLSLHKLTANNFVAMVTMEHNPCEISSSHGGEYEAQNLLGCTAMFLI
jgi:hypothetical protein